MKANNKLATWLDLKSALVVLSPSAARREKTAARMLVEEIEKRTQLRLPLVDALPAGSQPFIWLSRVSELPGPIRATFDGEEIPTQAEGYSIQTLSLNGASGVAAAGADERGVLFAAGCLLRSLSMGKQRLALPADFSVTTAPQYRLRGHQLGYRDKTNSYDAWDLRQWEQYIREMAVFGANAIELIPPRSDDKDDSVHFPLPPMEMNTGMSRIADEYGIDVWVWFPAMDPDYSDPLQVERALREWDEVFRQLPRIDAVFVPGGDPGKARPSLLMPLLEQQKRQLMKYHPRAQMWVSPQGFTGEWMEEFLSILRSGQVDWLDGVVHGPWVHLTMPEFRAIIPARFPLRNYPDITHSLNCQFPVPDWDAAFALTEGRETINPRPHDQAAIFRVTAPDTIGFLTYSEGCNDDVNKFIWSGLGWDPQRPVIEILREYSRFFIGEDYTDTFAQGLLALERNWRGPLLANQGVNTTLQQFQALEDGAPPQVLQNWRFQQALYRAYYDAYVRARLLHESSLEVQAREALRKCRRDALGVSWGSLRALEQAQRILEQAFLQPVAAAWRTRLFQLAEALFQSIRMQLSVHLYQGQEEVRGANLDGIDYPLTDAPWLLERFAAIRQLPEESARIQAIVNLLHWRDPGPGGIYVDLVTGDPSDYIVPGLPYEQDPAFIHTAARKYPYRKAPQAQPLAWRGFTGTLNDQPFQLRFSGLDPDGSYRVRIVYAEQQPHHPPVKVRLDAQDGIAIHPFQTKPVPRAPVEFDIPREATRGGVLTLTWRREPGKGGIGLGCDLSEIWIMKKVVTTQVGR